MLGTGGAVLRCTRAQARAEAPTLDTLFLLTLAIAAGIVSVGFVYTGVVLYREYRHMRRGLPPRPRGRLVR